jgi:alpha-L-fucosidase 2
MGEHRIWFERPAADWNEALPLGNGRTGAMLFGGVDHELIQLNDGTAWSGSPESSRQEPQLDPAVSREALAEARDAIRLGDYDTATRSLKKIQHRHSQTFLPFADLTIDTPGIKGAAGFRRELDLSTAKHRVTFGLSDGGIVTRETFISASSNVLVHTFEADTADGVELIVGLKSPLLTLAEKSERDRRAILIKMPSDVYAVHDEVEQPVVYSEDNSLSLQGALVVGWAHDGVEDPSAGAKLRATGVRSATIVLATQTTFTAIGQPPSGTAEDAYVVARARVVAALATGARGVSAQHEADHAHLYDRVELNLEGTDFSGLPVDERLRRGNAHSAGVLAADPGLAALLFHFGRYLLISSSREGGVPANLQGIWNPSLQPPWSSNYTININTQMNYWMAESANLVECLPPLFDLIDGLMVTGADTAQRLYDAPGWVAHHNSDIWAYSLPVGAGTHEPKWAFWPMAAPWLVRHLWERVLHGGSEAFIRQRAWSPIRSAAAFSLAWLVEQPDGTLGTSPSTSPENVFSSADGVKGQAARSSAYDLAVLADLFSMVDVLANRLGIEGDPIVDAARAALQQLDVPRIGPTGLVQEWKDDFNYPDPQHRHVGHLYFAYPGDRLLSEEWARAVSRSLDERGDESTGWSLAWKMVLRARLGQASKVDDLLALMFRDMEVDRGPWIGGLYANMFAAHPPFQIDGNLGYVAAIAECIVQSHLGYIDLLPAVPGSMNAGSIRGLRARPGVEVDVRWEPGERGSVALVDATFRAATANAVGQHRIRWADRHVFVTLDEFEPVTVTLADFSSVPSTHEDLSATLPNGGLPT